MEAGCQELDMVMNLTAFKSQEYGDVVQDIIGVRRQSDSAILKVIIEAPQLSEKEIRKAVDLCVDGGADYVKTSTAGTLRIPLPWNRSRSWQTRRLGGSRSRQLEESVLLKPYMPCSKPDATDLV